MEFTPESAHMCYCIHKTVKINYIIIKTIIILRVTLVINYYNVSITIKLLY